MNAICIFTAGILFAITPVGNGATASSPALAAATSQPAILPISDQNTDEAQPTPALRSPAELQEEVRQLKQRVAALERQLQSGQGPQVHDTRRKAMGRLVLDNRTLSAHAVSANGFLFSIAPGRTEIEIPIGTATVYLPYHEAPRLWGLDRWRWNGQRYELLVEVRGR